MIIKGDIDGDGRITPKDLAIIQASMLSESYPTGDAFIAGDINGDGAWGVVDLAGINMHLLGVKMITEVVE